MIAHLTCIVSALPTEASALESAISALESSITTLDKSSSCLEGLLPWFTGAVVLGVVVEVVFLVHEHRENMAAWARGIIRPPDKPSRRWLALEIAATVLIAVGVTGELGIGIAIRQINERLHTKNSELRTKSERLVALLNIKAAGLSKDVEAEKIERLKLQAIVNPRSLSLDQQRKIASALGSFVNHRVTVSSYGLDGEGFVLATQLIAILRSAGLIVDDRRADIIVSGGFEQGVHVRGPESEQRLISAIGDGLQVIGKQEVFVNDRIFLPATAISGAASLSGSASISGVGSFSPSRFLPPGQPVTIQVGIKPIHAIATIAKPK